MSTVAPIIARRAFGAAALAGSAFVLLTLVAGIDSPYRRWAGVVLFLLLGLGLLIWPPSNSPLPPRIAQFFGVLFLIAALFFGIRTGAPVSGGLLGALFGFGLLLAGARMVLHPNAYIGTGHPPAQDPRTVRFFGAFFAMLGGAIFVLALIQFVQE